MILLKQKNIFFSAPGPTTAVSYMSVKCVDVRKNHHKAKWLMPWGPNQCDKIRDIEEAIPREIEANDIVFSVHIPLPSMEMSPWFQFMLFILQLDIAFKLNNQISKCTLPTPLLSWGISLFSLFRASCNRREIILLLVTIIDCFLLTRCVSEYSTWINPFYFSTSS